MMKWLCAIAIGGVLVGCGDKKKTPPKPNIVAIYSNGEITLADLEDYLEQRIEGLKVLLGDSLVALKDQIPEEKEVYRGLIREMVLDDMAKRKIKEKQLDNRGNIRHALKHLEDEFTLQQLHGEMHEKDRIPVSEIDIQRYYDENRSQFGDKPLYEARNEIKRILASQKEGDYVLNYISELKDAATITKDSEILRVPEPTQDEVRQAYEGNKEAYVQPEKWAIQQIEIVDTTARAKNAGQRAWAKLGAGESFEAVAEAFGRGSTFTNINYVTGMRGEAFDKAVASLNPGEFSKPIQEGGKYFIVRLQEKIPASHIPFEKVQGVIRRTLMDEREKKLYEEDKNKTLFTLHGRRFTLGDFYQEFSELPATDQEKYRTYDQRVQFVDRMIERLLLLEDSYDRMLNAKNKEEIEHVREDVLKQALHQEEVDRKLEVSDEEVKKFYEENKERFKTPPRAKISLIMAHGGDDEASNKKAKKKIEEAYEKLQSGFFKKAIPFEEVARQYSENPPSAQNGGKLDRWIGETGNPVFEMFNHPFHEKFMDLKEGEMTEPFLLGHDYLIIKVRERDEPRQRSFEEVKDHLKEDLEARKHDELTAQMYKNMLDRANLVIYDQVLEAMLNKSVDGS